MTSGETTNQSAENARGTRRDISPEVLMALAESVLEQGVRLPEAMASDSGEVASGDTPLTPQQDFIDRFNAATTGLNPGSEDDTFVTRYKLLSHGRFIPVEDNNKPKN